jgi:hypothetical protein
MGFGNKKEMKIKAHLYATGRMPRISIRGGEVGALHDAIMPADYGGLKTGR